MNNSKFAIEGVRLSLEEESKPDFSDREAKLTSIIEALSSIRSSKEWSTLKHHIFDKLAEGLEKDILREVQKDSLDMIRISKLSGQLKWAERYSDLEKIENIYRSELANIKQRLYGETPKIPAS